MTCDVRVALLRALWAHAASRSDAADLVHLEAALAKSSDERLCRLALLLRSGASLSRMAGTMSDW